jgi:hypothetical protein
MNGRTDTGFGALIDLVWGKPRKGAFIFVISLVFNIVIVFFFFLLLGHLHQFVSMINYCFLYMNRKMKMNIYSTRYKYPTKENLCFSLSVPNYQEQNYEVFFFLFFGVFGFFCSFLFLFFLVLEDMGGGSKRVRRESEARA